MSVVNESPNLEARRLRSKSASRISRAITIVGVVFPLLVIAAGGVWSGGARIVAAALALAAVAAIVAIVRLERAYRATVGPPGRWRERELIANNHEEIPAAIRLLYWVSRGPWHLG
jgi:hypothetical protein